MRLKKTAAAGLMLVGLGSASLAVLAAARSSITATLLCGWPRLFQSMHVRLVRDAMAALAI